MLSALMTAISMIAITIRIIWHFFVLACLFVFLVVASTKKHGAREHNRDNRKERTKEYERKPNNTQRNNHDRETLGKIDVARLHRAAFAGSAVHEPAVAVHQVAYGSQLCLFPPLLHPKILLVSPNNMLLAGLSRKRFRTDPFEIADSNALYSGSRIPGNFLRTQPWRAAFSTLNVRALYAAPQFFWNY